MSVKPASDEALPHRSAREFLLRIGHGIDRLRADGRLETWSCAVEGCLPDGDHLQRGFAVRPPRLLASATMDDLRVSANARLNHLMNDDFQVGCRRGLSEPPMELQAILRRRVTVADARWLPSGHGIDPVKRRTRGVPF